MKGMKLYKKATGGYLSALEQSKPELFQTIKSYRDRLSGGEKETFDKRANIQYSATMNMPKNQRDAYIQSIEKEYSKPSDAQFKQIKSSLGESLNQPILISQEILTDLLLRQVIIEIYLKKLKKQTKS